MKLWDREIDPLETTTARLTLAERLALGVEAVEFTLRTEQRPVADERAARWITEVLGHARRAVDAGQESVPLPERLEDESEALQEDVQEDGVPQLISGMVDAFAEADDPEDQGLQPRHLGFLLESCYSFALERLPSGPQSLEDEENSPRCREVIAYQRELINRAAS